MAPGVVGDALVDEDVPVLVSGEQLEAAVAVEVAGDLAVPQPVQTFRGVRQGPGLLEGIAAAVLEDPELLRTAGAQEHLHASVPSPSPTSPPQTSVTSKTTSVGKEPGFGVSTRRTPLGIDRHDLDPAVAVEVVGVPRMNGLEER